MQRRKFLSVTPTVLGLKPLADICDPDEFLDVVVAAGELPLGVKWAVTEMDVTKHETPKKTDSKTPTNETEKKTSIDSPTVLGVDSEFVNHKTSYLDSGQTYTITVTVGVPFTDALTGIEFNFESFDGFPWEPLFELSYQSKDESLESYKHPPATGYVVYDITMRFEFERMLGRFYVFLTDGEKETEKKDLLNESDSDVVLGKAVGEAATKGTATETK